MDSIRGALVALDIIVTFLFVVVGLQTLVKEKDSVTGATFIIFGIIMAMNGVYVLKA